MSKVIYYRNYGVGNSGGYTTNISEITEILIPNCAGMINWQGEISPWSRHDYYLLYLVKGEMEILSCKPTERMKEGNFICFYPETKYEYKTLNGEVEYLFVHFSGHSAAQIVESCGIKNSKVYNAGVLKDVKETFRELFFDFSRQDYLFPLRSSSNLLKILTRFSEKIDASGETLVSKKLRRSIDYIHENYNKDICIPKLAELEHLSASRYYSLFKENTGFSPSEYIIVLRIKRACTLIREEYMTVKEIAAEVGYHDPFYFSRLFKKHMGVSPSEYKKSDIMKN